MDDETYSSTSPSSHHDDGEGSVVNIENMRAILDDMKAKTAASSNNIEQMNNDDSSYETVEIIEEPSEYETIEEEVVYSDYVTDSESELETNEGFVKSSKDHSPLPKPTKMRGKKTADRPDKQESNRMSPPASPTKSPNQKKATTRVNTKRGPQDNDEEPDEEEMMEDDGTISKEIMPDLLHLSPAGYQIWADALEPKLQELGL